MRSPSSSGPIMISSRATIVPLTRIDWTICSRLAAMTVTVVGGTSGCAAAARGVGASSAPLACAAFSITKRVAALCGLSHR